MYDAALQQYNRTLEIDPEFAPAFDRMGYAFRRQGRYPEALAADRRAANYWDPSGASVLIVDSVAAAYAASGEKGYFQKKIELDKTATTHASNYYRAVWAAGLRDKNQTLRLLRESYEKREADLLNLRNDPEFDFLRLDPDFLAVVKSVGFPKQDPQ